MSEPDDKPWLARYGDMDGCLPLLFALVWWVNGLICKVLDLVPRHREIVARLLGDEHALALTRAIGVGEIILGVWIYSAWKWKWSATVQILGVAAMNVIELCLASDLLLFGRWNALIALAYIIWVAYAGFFLPSPTRLRP